MRIAAMVLGLIGGLISACGVYWGWPAVGAGYLAWGILFPLIGITGGILALRRPKLSGILMLVGGTGAWSVLLAVLVFGGFYCRVYGAPRLCGPHFAFYEAFTIGGSPLFIGAGLSLAASREHRRASVAAMALGLLGGLIGLLAVWDIIKWVLMVYPTPGEYVLWAILFSLMSLIGITGATRALTRPKVSGILMALSGMGGWGAVIGISVFYGLTYVGAHLHFLYTDYLIAGPPLILGSALSFAASKEYDRGSIGAMILGLIGGFVSLLLVDVRALYFADGMRAETIALGLLLPAIGFAGGVLALTRPALAGALMFICGVSGILAAFQDWPHHAYAMGYMYSSLPFFVGAALSFTAPGEYRRGGRLTSALGVGRGILGGFGAMPAFARRSRLILALGVAGGVLGGFGAFSAFTYQCPVMIPWTSLVFLMAVGGGILAVTRPKVGGGLMLLAAIAGWLAPVGMIALQWGIYLNWMGFYVAAFYFLAGLLLIAGGALALTSRKEQPAAINAAMVLGIIGGLLAGVCALVVDPPFMLQAEELLFWKIHYGIWVLLFAVMGFTAGILALKRPKAAGTLMLISGVSGGIGYYLLRDVPLAWLFGGYECWLCALASVLLMLGGAFALTSAKKQPKEEASP
ncbi:hypothetical protein M1N19_01810 [Dehalococcoidia bacterium]|nr:hypothetical protein [Dehalococcoidia bacterium]MCL0064203.1 hypothetical protein [Dehalococcoidia bacterium]